MDASEYDAMLHDALAERDEMNASKQKKLRLVTAACFLTLIGSAYAWYASSASNQAMVHNLWSDTVAMSNDVKDSADVGKIMETYDAATDKIAVRQDQVMDSAEALGQDRNDNDAASQKRLEQDMKSITGDARTVAERDAALREKFGKFAEEKRREIEAEKARRAAEGE